MLDGYCDDEAGNQKWSGKATDLYVENDSMMDALRLSRSTHDVGCQVVSRKCPTSPYHHLGIQSCPLTSSSDLVPQLSSHF